MTRQGSVERKRGATCDLIWLFSPIHQNWIDGQNTQKKTKACRFVRLRVSLEIDEERANCEKTNFSIWEFFNGIQDLYRLYEYFVKPYRSVIEMISNINQLHRKFRTFNYLISS